LHRFRNMHASYGLPRPIHVGKISAENLKKAHAKVERGRSQGKLVLKGF
jgi:hypothetical protein